MPPHDLAALFWRGAGMGTCMHVRLAGNGEHYSLLQCLHWRRKLPAAASIWIQVPSYQKRHPCRGAFKLSTKCRQLERQKWKLPKKFPFLRVLNVKGDSPSPFTIPLTDPGLDKKRFVYSLKAPLSGCLFWCGHGDLNPNAFRHRNLNPACLPIPSRPPV